MKYAYGLVDKNNIIRTVEDIMCVGNDTSHETITDFKQEITDKINDFYTKTETLDHIDSAITDFQNDVLKKSYITRATTLARINEAIENYATIEYVGDKIDELDDKIGMTADSIYVDLASNTIPEQIDAAISDFMDNELPDQYCDREETEQWIINSINSK